MNRIPLKRIVLFLFFLVPILWVAKESFPTSANFNFDIQSHHLNIFSVAGTTMFFLKGGAEKGGSFPPLTKESIIEQTYSSENLP